MELAVRLPAFRSVPAGRAGIAVPKPDLSDGELIRLIADGDRDAFEQLYQRYARSVYGLALRRLRDRERAEDAVQETFTSIWRSASSYRAEQGSGAPWLYAVARNAIVDRFRSMPAESGDVPETATREPGPEERVESASTAWQVHRAFGELPDSEQRDVLGEDVRGEELERLRRVHELLLEAGPPPELPPALAAAPGMGELPRQEELGWLPPRRVGRALTFAAAFAVL